MSRRLLSLTRAVSVPTLRGGLILAQLDGLLCFLTIQRVVNGLFQAQQLLDHSSLIPRPSS